MKKITTILFIASFLFAQAAFSQKNITILEKTTTMSLGPKNGFMVTIPNMTTKEASKELKGWITDQQKKVVIDDVSKTEIMVDNLIIPELSENPVDIYFVMAASGSDVNITGIFDMGNGFLSSVNQPVKYKDGENYMRKFAWHIEKNNVTAKLNDAQKTLSNSQDAQKDLEKENKSLNDDIIECQQKIDQAKADLQQNQKDQDAKKLQIEAQTKAVNDVSTELKLYDPY